MRAVIQRVSRASVGVGGELVGAIERGVMVLVGVHTSDSLDQAQAVADKIANLRIFDDPEGRMNLSLLETGGSALVVSQFTLYGDTRKGRRPSYIEAAKGEVAESLYLALGDRLRELGIPVATGRFGATMEVELINDGPVTILVDTAPG